MMRWTSLTAILLLTTALWAQESGWIGVRMEDQKERGAIIRNVEPNSPATKAGLKEGDVIIQFNKEDVVGVQQFTRLVRETPAGRTVEIKIRRDNRDQTFHVTTEKLPNFPNGLGRFDIQIPRIRGRDFPQIQVTTTAAQSGIRVERLTDQLRDFFGVYSNSGVLVTSIESGSPAEKAGLKAGDVITSIEGTTIRTPNEFSHTMRARGSKTMLKIIRDKQEKEISLEGQ